MKKRNQIESALINDILSITNRTTPQTIPSVQTIKDDIQLYVEYQFELKRARTTINSRLRAIKTMFQYAVTKNYIFMNPATAIPNFRVRH